jgi:hypothetical protein
MLPLRSKQDDNRHDLRIVGLILCLVLSRDDGWQERQAAPIQMSHRLCEKNDKYYSSKAREVKRLRYAFVLTVDTCGHSLETGLPCRRYRMGGGSWRGNNDPPEVELHKSPGLPPRFLR